MLDFALQYLAAIDDVTSRKMAGLHQYELNDEEWGIACQLCTSLEGLLIVPDLGFPFTHLLHRFSRTQHCASRVQCQTLQPSFQQWTILTRH
jgi:hypothetical protein